MRSETTVHRSNLSSQSMYINTKLENVIQKNTTILSLVVFHNASCPSTLICDNYDDQGGGMYET
jgi:hypothetical protein